MRNLKVLIVAKTRMSNGVCVGAIATETGESVRLVPSNASTNSEYEVGDTWNIQAEPKASLEPPHTEDIDVRKACLISRPTGGTENLIASIERLMPPKVGGPQVLYDGLLQRTSRGALYIARGGVPSYSTMFWRPDQPLARFEDPVSQKPKYRYPTETGSCRLPFVGYEEPLWTIPAKTLLRVSLARWWKPEDANVNVDERCYVQISGWFLETERRAEQVALLEP